jgi:hypothetical protein
MAARDIGDLIKESQAAGRLTEYIDRLKEIQEALLKRAQANHPQR